MGSVKLNRFTNPKMMLNNPFWIHIKRTIFKLDLPFSNKYFVSFLYSIKNKKYAMSE